MIPAPRENAARSPQGAELVVVGGSAGALAALEKILPRLPPCWRLPVVVVVHLPRRAPSALASVLSARTPFPVEQAVDKQPLMPGTIYVAAPDYHLLVDPGPALALSVDEPVQFSIPSIDVLFESAAATCREGVVAVLLSGASADGANGLAAVCAAGGVAVVQAPDDAAVDTMPRAALLRCPGAAVVPAAEIASFLCSLTDRSDPVGLV